ncbi:cupin domain-containing protein [Acetobacter nitrogenifigens]|uniref:cupin domain-containing protein n=1 Tax=Acetobacter nitrogenifigens TaxID=285268 RepID=UPI0013766FB3|nr:cupin domain-containing protein [Acetobacter nitrogenifigens]
MRVPPGHSACPAHTHLQADEIFVVLEGKGLFRYGDHVYEIHPGDCISCPADTGIAHQIANPPPPADVCTYPDSGSISVGGVKRFGLLREAGYYEGQPQPTPLLTRDGKAQA